MLNDACDEDYDRLPIGMRGALGKLCIFEKKKKKRQLNENGLKGLQSMM